MRKTLTSYLHDEMLLRLHIRKAVEDAGLTATNAELKYLADRFVGKKIEMIREGLEEMPPESVTPKERLEGRAQMRAEAREFVEEQIERVEKYWRDSRPGGPEDPDRTRTDRAIDKEIWDKRGYTRWPASNDSKFYLSDVSAVAEAYGKKTTEPHKRKGLNGHQIGYMKMLARQSPGWVMPRLAVPEAKLGHVYAEIRPDTKVITGPPTRHWHGVKGEEPEELKANTGVRTLLKDTEAFRQHCRRVDAENEGEGLPPHETVKGVHQHPDEAKYVFPPSPKMDVYYDHDHSDPFYDDYPEELVIHLEYWHSEPDYVEGYARATHVHKRRVKDHSNSLAKRLDIHPMALERLESAGLVYFALEGVLKADAILSAIIREGRNESVFDVPSVSLWHAPELEGFARNYLKGKTVIIVPDADWVDNDLVIAHARSAEIFLKKRGIDCYVAAPPLDDDHKILKNAAGDKLKGVDDYLAEGHSLDSLAVLERSENPNIARERKLLEDRSRWWDGRKLRSDGLDTYERVTRKLAYLANSEGYVKTSQEKLADIMGVAQSTVSEHIEALMNHGWITAETKVEDVWKPANKIPKSAKRYITVDGLHIYTSEDWRDSTRLRVRKDLRAIDHDTITIAKLLERPRVEAERRRRIKEAKRDVLDTKRKYEGPSYRDLIEINKRRHVGQA